MNEVWSTKFGPRRVRHDPPVIELKKASTRRKAITLTSTDRKGMVRAVVVERRPSRTLVMSRSLRS